MKSPRFDNTDLYLMATSASKQFSPLQTAQSASPEQAGSAAIQQAVASIINNADFIAKMARPNVEFCRVTQLARSQKSTGEFCLTFQFDGTESEHPVSFVLRFHCTAVGRIRKIQPGPQNGNQTLPFQPATEQLVEMKRAVMDAMQAIPTIGVEPFYQQFLDDGDIERLTREFVNASAAK